MIHGTSHNHAFPPPTEGVTWYIFIDLVLESLLFTSTSSIELCAYTDVDWDIDSNHHNSTTSFCIFLGDSLIFTDSVLGSLVPFHLGTISLPYAPSALQIANIFTDSIGVLFPLLVWKLSIITVVALWVWESMVRC